MSSRQLHVASILAVGSAEMLWDTDVWLPALPSVAGHVMGNWPTFGKGSNFRIQECVKYLFEKLGVLVELHFQLKGSNLCQVRCSGLKL